MKHAIVTVVIAFVVGVVLYPAYLTVLVRLGLRQHVAAYGPSTHRAKEGTPTLGGALFCAIVVIAWLALDRSREGFVAVFALLAGALAGALDDTVNIRGVRLGLPMWHKLALQGFVGILVGAGLFIAGYTHQFFPGLGAPNLGWGIIILAAIAVVATSNAVNLTDGVDGLAATCTGVVFFGVAVIAIGDNDLPVTIIAAALTGSIAAFLVYNWAPARLFMGDTGSLALGWPQSCTCCGSYRYSASCSWLKRSASSSTSPRSAVTAGACFAPARCTITSKRWDSASSVLWRRSPRWR
jgi:phospho-N-acetylmuramoyl-pentapeptide-transferase